MGFPISDLVKNPDGTHVVNFAEIRRAQLARSTLLTSTMVPLRSSRYFNVCSMLKREWGAEINGKLLHLLIPSKTANLGF